MTQPTRLAMLVCALAAAPGCDSSRNATTNNSGASAATAKPSATSPRNTESARTDAVSVSQAREQALAFLAKAAASTDAEERYNALEASLPVPSRLEPLLRRGLTDSDDRVRIVAAMVAGKAKVRGVMPQLRALSGDKSEMVQAAAVFALSRCGEEQSPQVLASLLQHPRPLFRAHAAYLLGELGNPSALPMVRDAAREGSGRNDPAQTRVYQLQLCEAMIKLGDNRALDEVRAALYPSRPDELEGTTLAVQIIGQVKDRPSMGQLVRLIDNVDPQSGRMPAEVRLAAAASLAKMGQPHGGYVADEFRSSEVSPIRAQAALLYGETGKRAYLGTLLEMMESDPDPLVRVAAAGGVLKITDPSR